MPEPQHSAEVSFDPSDEYRPEPEPEAGPPAWMDGSVRIGIHTSIAGDITRSLDIAQRLGCNALQIFSASPRLWPTGAARIRDVDAQKFRARRAELGLGPLAMHANYLINLAATQPMLRTRSVQAFHDEITRAGALGGDFLVLHPGARGEARWEQAVEAVVQGIRQAARGVRFGSLRILIENTSGTGTALGWRFEEVAAILERLSDLPVGVCVDTAHTFEAGYDIRSSEGLERTLHQIDDTIGLRRVLLIHVNDSKTPLGSRVDRHEHVGKGKIGLEAFRRILNHPRLSASGPQGLPGRAFILETPIDRPGDDRRNVKTLWALAGFTAKQAPRAEDGFSTLRGRQKKTRAASKVQKRAKARKRSASRSKRKG